MFLSNATGVEFTFIVITAYYLLSDLILQIFYPAAACGLASRVQFCVRIEDQFLGNVKKRANLLW